MLVTGGAKRIGRAICLSLAADGYSIAVHYRGSKEEAEEVVMAVEESGGTAFTVQADLAEADSASTLVARASDNGPLRGIVNNASLFMTISKASTHRIGMPT